MAKAAVVAAAAALAAGAAFAQAAPGLLGAGLRHTLASTYPDGRVSKLWLARMGHSTG